MTALTKDPNRRRAIILLAGSALVVTAIVVTIAIALAPRTPVVLTAGPQGTSEPVAPTMLPTATPSGENTGAPVVDADAAASAAASAVEEVVAAANALLADPSSPPADLADYTGGFVEGELRALAAERESLGYTQVGTAEITSITTRKQDLAGDPPMIYLNVCIDSSGVDVLDSSGASLRASLYDPGHPVLNVYGAQYTGGRWKITTHALLDTTSPATNTAPDKKKAPCA